MSYINKYNSINYDERNIFDKNIFNEENIFRRPRFINYDRIYNRFLTNHYPPLYYKNSSIEVDNLSKNKIFEEANKIYEDKDENLYEKRRPDEYENIYSLIKEKNYNNHNQDLKNDYFKNDFPLKEDRNQKIKESPSENEQNKNENYRYNPSYNNYHYNNNESDTINQNIKNYNNYKITESHYNKNNENQYNNNQRYLRNNSFCTYRDLNKEDINSFGAFDESSRNTKNKGYISPIITQIAKKNYLGDNPFTGKNQNLGPTTLKSNPIVYPINTYKIDLNRYKNKFSLN